MSKLATAFALLTRGDIGRCVRLVRLNLRRLRAWWSVGRPFTYSRNGVRWACFPASPASLDLFLSDSADLFELSILQKWLEPGDAAIDVGANIGVYAIAAAHATGPTGRVLAVEPSDKLAVGIEAAARLLELHELRVVAACAGEASGQTDFFIADESSASAEQSRRMESTRQVGYKKITVPMDTLDGLARRHLGDEQPSMIKIDIEGAELLALRGATDLLNTANCPLWMVELNPSALARFGVAAAEVSAEFPATGFERWLVPHYPHDRSKTLPPRRLQPSEQYDDALFYNLVALPLAGCWASRGSHLRPLLPSA